MHNSRSYGALEMLGVASLGLRPPIVPHELRESVAPVG